MKFYLRLLPAGICREILRNLSKKFHNRVKLCEKCDTNMTRATKLCAKADPDMLGCPLLITNNDKREK